MLRVVIEAGNVVKVLPAGLNEAFPCFHINFFDRLQAVRREPWAHNSNMLDSLCWHGLERFVSVGL